MIAVYKVADYGPCSGQPETLVGPGDVIHYTIMVSNSVNGNLTKVNVTDSLIDLDGPFGDNNNDGILNYTEFWTYTGNYTVTEKDVCNDIENTVTVNATDPNGNILEDVVVSYCIPTIFSSHLNVTKTADYNFGMGGPKPGDIITYAINVTNPGNVNLTDVNVTDSQIDLTGPEGDVNDDQYLNTSEIWTYTGTYTVTEKDICGGWINNTATASATDPCTNVLKDEANHSIPIQYVSASFGVDKEADYGPCPYDNVARPGDVINYTITVTPDNVLNLTKVNVTDSQIDLAGPEGDVNDDQYLNTTEIWTYTGNYTVTVYDVYINNTVTANAINPCGKVLEDVSAYWCVPVEYKPGIDVSKTALQKSVERGDEITYIIEIRSLGGKPLHNVVVRDVFYRCVEFVSASPMPDNEGIWRFDTVDSGSVTITLVVKVPETQDFEFGMGSGISGEGFVNVADDYSTTLQSYDIKNCVYVTSDETGSEVFSDCEHVTVGGDFGTELHTREHGSGDYESDEQIKMLTENKSIEMSKAVTTDYKPTTLGLYRNRSITYDTKWIEKARAKNRITGTTMYEAYHYATHIDRDSYINMDKNGTTMIIDSTFDGQGHIGILKKSHPNATAREPPLFESREDYTGSFRIYERVDEYGSSVVTDKSTSGTGLVAVNKRVKDNQKTYESGTGSYDSEELIRTHTNYIAKDISLAHEPMNRSLTDDVSINASLKWKEGMVSKNPKTSLIGEEYTSIERLEKDTVASGLNQMDTEAEFSGRAEYRAIIRDEFDLDESYAGEYSIKRRVLFQGIPKYDHPHLNVTKVLVGIAKEKIGTKEVIFAGEDTDKIIDVATYNITVENDGDRALHPIYVRDIFPPGSKYIDASARPTELTSTSANWTLTHLSVGDVSTITLRLDVTEHRGDELVNRAEACGEYNGDRICGANFSALEVDWLTCCLNETAHVTKTAQVDQNATNVVMYTLTIQNLEDCTRVAQVTDILPEGMKLLGASIPPSSYVNGTVTWNLIDLAPRDTKKIVYRTEALRSGTFVNEARVDVRSVDGSVVRPVYVSAAVTVGEFEGEISAPGWQPPDWGIDSGCEECNELTS
ncbi:MAG: DUF7507 domain-containing protein [Methanotrichaceae archaeon]